MNCNNLKESKQSYLKRNTYCVLLIDWLVFNSSFSSISAISCHTWCNQFLPSFQHWFLKHYIMFACILMLCNAHPKNFQYLFNFFPICKNIYYFIMLMYILWFTGFPGPPGAIPPAGFPPGSMPPGMPPMFPPTGTNQFRKTNWTA